MREQTRQQFGRLWRDLASRLRTLPARQRGLVSLGLAGVVVGAVILAAVMPRITTASDTNLLANGSFEHGFGQIAGCGIVGAQWDCFTNGGAANYGFYDDQWDLVVADGHHSQLIEVNTKGLAAGDNDRYAGIAQTVRVVKGEKYKFSMRGMIRTTVEGGDPYRYSVQVGYLDGPHGDWRDVKNWTDAGWTTYYERTKPGSFSDFQTILVPDSEVITVFVRVWKKWGVAFEELDVNLDAIALSGRSPAMGKPMDGQPMGEAPMGGQPMGGTGGPMMGGPEAMSMGAGSMDQWGRMDDNRPLICNGQDLVSNGSFEQGFNRTPLGEVGRGWGAFTNGGAAAYGFYDEEWRPVIADGHHGQLIEINSKGIYPTQDNRYAGIYQKLEGLHPGGVYELTLRGLLRGTGNEEDPYRFAAQWAVGSSPDWAHIEDDDWTEMDLGPIYKRTEPGSMATYTVRFKADSPNAVLFIRGWKKWAITDVEMDFNLDAIQVRSCEPQGQAGGWMPDGGMGGSSGSSCLYVVKPGDSLSAVAAQHGVGMQDIVRANGISDPDSIYVGQKLEIPGCGKGGEMAPMPMPREDMDNSEMRRSPMEPESGPGMADRRPSEGRMHAVRSGESLGLIAEKYGVDVYALATANGIENMNLIYEGQVLRIPG
jgi:LysM repeat protein